MKSTFFQAAVVSILLCGCTTWTITKRMEKKIDGNYTRILPAIMSNSWRWHPTKQLLYGYLPPIMKNIQVRRARHVGHCWRSKEELISGIPLWVDSFTWTSKSKTTYIQQLCADIGCSLEDLPGAMDDNERWREKVRDIRDDGSTWWG